LYSALAKRDWDTPAQRCEGASRCYDRRAWAPPPPSPRSAPPGFLQRWVLDRAAFMALRKLDTPQKIQEFINAIPTNHEPDDGCTQVGSVR
jgi:hypothetical protein